MNINSTPYKILELKESIYIYFSNSLIIRPNYCVHQNNFIYDNHSNIWGLKDIPITI